jgi:prepilin-type N-terminal cleavage/methylation domain-containing protein
MRTDLLNRNERERGVTLLELLISLAIVALVTAASARAFSLAIGYDQHLRASRAAALERETFQDTITTLLHHAWLSSTATDANSYFIGGAPSQTASSTTAPAGLQSTLRTSNTPISSGTGTSSSGASQGSGVGAYGTPNTLVFCVGGMAPLSTYLASNDDFETLNTNFGPQGGIQEVQISQDPVGGQGQGKTGLFIRVQTPADDDPTQGGNETMICPELTQLGFELFDGNQWQTSWDSRSQGTTPGAMPAAIRVTYRFKGDTEDRVFVVRIPASTTSYLKVVSTPG